MCLVPEGESYPSSRVVSDALPSALLLGTARRRQQLLARGPENTTCSEFSRQKWASLRRSLRCGAEVQL